MISDDSKNTKMNEWTVLLCFASLLFSLTDFIKFTFPMKELETINLRKGHSKNS